MSGPSRPRGLPRNDGRRASGLPRLPVDDVEPLPEHFRGAPNRLRLFVGLRYGTFDSLQVGPTLPAQLARSLVSQVQEPRPSRVPRSDSFQRYRKALVRYLYQLAGSLAEAEDSAQETCVRLLNGTRRSRIPAPGSSRWSRFSSAIGSGWSGAAGSWSLGGPSRSPTCRRCPEARRVRPSCLRPRLRDGGGRHRHAPTPTVGPTVSRRVKPGSDSLFRVPTDATPPGGVPRRGSSAASGAFASTRRTRESLPTFVDQSGSAQDRPPEPCVSRIAGSIIP